MGEPARVETSADPDPVDFADLMARHQAMVFSCAFHFVRDRSAAEELAQDVFLQLFRDLPSLSSPDHITFWLRKVTSHRCIDYARRRLVDGQPGRGARTARGQPDIRPDPPAAWGNWSGRCRRRRASSSSCVTRRI